MDVPQPVPKLSLQVPETVFVVLPVACEVGSAIGEPSLNDQPTTTICTHIAVGQLTSDTECIGGEAEVSHIIETIWSHPE